MLLKRCEDRELYTMHCCIRCTGMGEELRLEEV